MCSSREGYELNDAEVGKAIQFLDKNNDGLISFEEFVDWWVNEVRVAALFLNNIIRVML